MNNSDLAPIFGLLRRYYARKLTRIDAHDWPLVSEHKRNLAPGRTGIAAALARIAQAPTGDAERLEYDYNKLFVGPGRVFAPPFETVYRSSERTLMREITLSVRAAYADSGMQVDAKNVQPDDHAAYECAFVAFLLERGAQGDAQALANFCREHLTRWVFDHTEAIRHTTSNEICLGFADLFEAALTEISREDEERP